MTTIHKKKLQITDVQEIELPICSTIRYLGTQGEDVCIWYECDPSLPKVKLRIYCYGTGHPMGTKMQRYIGTAVVLDGRGVFHFYLDNTHYGERIKGFVKKIEPDGYATIHYEFKDKEFMCLFVPKAGFKEGDRVVITVTKDELPSGKEVAHEL